MTKRPDIPAWPSMMKRSTAAAYLDLSEPSFIKEIAAGRLPTGILLGGREHWRKDAIDAAIGHLGATTVPEHIREFDERIQQMKGAA